MSAQATPQRKQYSAEEIRAFQRKDFSSQLDFASLILQHIGYPTKRHRDWVCAIQGLCGGKLEPVECAHLSVAERCGYKATDPEERRKTFARREIEVHEQFKARTGIAVFDIERPGEDGNEKNRFTDCLTPASNWAMNEMRNAMNSDPKLWNSKKLHPELWRKNEMQQEILEKRFAIYRQQVEVRNDIVRRAAKMLPSYKPEDNPTPEKESGTLSLGEYEDHIKDRVLAMLERAFDQIYEQGGSPEAFARKLAALIKKRGETAERTCKKVLGRKMAGDVDTVIYGDSNTGDIFDDAPEASAETPEAGGGNSFVTPSPAKPLENKLDIKSKNGADDGGSGNNYVRHSEPQEAVQEAVSEEIYPLMNEGVNVEISQQNEKLDPEHAEPEMLAAALEYAAHGYAVFPLHTPDADGACSCREGKNCRNSGKHPRTKEGLKEATRDPKQIRKWWQKWPDANIAIATGEPSACIVLDIDSAHGGGAGLAALLEQVDLPETLEVETGKGAHLYFAYEGVDIRNSAGKLGEGLDVRGNGGYVVAAPSLHASGRRYRRANELLKIAPLPEELRQLMLAPPVTVSHVAPQRPRTGYSISGATIPAHERNERLFKIGCALWNEGPTPEEMYTYLLDVRDRRCEPGDHPVTDDEVRRIVKSVFDSATRRGWKRRAPAGQQKALR